MLALTYLVPSNHALSIAINIAIILVAAVIVRFLLIRAINQLVKRTVDGKVPVMLQPLKRRASQAMVVATGVSAERRRQRAETLASVLKSVVSITVSSIAAMTILDSIGISIGPIIASAGIAGIALGFGAQNLVKDFLNGIFMILEDQYGVGDLVDLGEASGIIEAVGLRTTRVRDGEGVIWYVRNGEVVRVGNKSQGTATVIVDMPVAHGTDLDRAQSILEAEAERLAADPQWSGTLPADPQVLGVESVTATGITMRVIIKVNPADRFVIGREARLRFSTAFEAAGIRTPVVPFGTTGSAGAGNPPK